LNNAFLYHVNAIRRIASVTERSFFDALHTKTAAKTIKNREIEGYGQHEVSF
jgi:hypothetical protein